MLYSAPEKFFLKHQTFYILLENENVISIYTRGKYKAIWHMKYYKGEN